MAKPFLRGRRWWCKLKSTERGWHNQATPYTLDDDPDGAQADRYRAHVQERLDAGTAFTDATGKAPTFAAYADREVQRRKSVGIASWDDDASRLKTHVYPAIGELRLDQVKPRHVAALIDQVRAKDLAPRTVRNVYAVIAAVFRRARIDGLIDGTPCILTRHELGEVHDADTEWRAGAVYTPAEVLVLLHDERVPQDRRVLYGLCTLGMLRHGEAAGLRWRHYQPGLEPLGRLVIATSYDEGHTKTRRERWMPVHPTLAALLAAWRLSGWPREFEKVPGPDDLIVPHTRPTNRGPRVEFGGMRSEHDSWKRLRKDLAALGLRARRVHDMRHTGITLAREGGADKDVLRRGTHAPSRDVIEQYTRASWERLCAQVLCVKLEERKDAVSGRP